MSKPQLPVQSSQFWFAPIEHPETSCWIKLLWLLERHFHPIPLTFVEEKIPFTGRCSGGFLAVQCPFPPATHNFSKFALSRNSLFILLFIIKCFWTVVFFPKMSCIFTHDFIFFSPLKFNLIIRKLLFSPPLITLLWQTANFTDIRSLQHVLETKREKKWLQGKPCIMESIWHAVPNHFFSPEDKKTLPSILSWKRRNLPWDWLNNHNHNYPEQI